MALSMTATVDASNSPPRVRLAITDSGTLSSTQVTVLRSVAGGPPVAVRTPQTGPLPLATTGATRSGFLFDYEMPFGVPVTYSLAENAAAKVTVTVDSERVWLVHPSIPDRSMPIELRVGSFDQEQYAVSSGIFRPLGRRNAVVITDGQRKGASGSFEVITEDFAELAAIRALIDDTAILLLNAPPLLGLGLDAQYVAVQDVTVRRRSDIGSDPGRFVTMPYVVTDSPIGGAQAQWSWADVKATYSTWAAEKAANPSWGNVRTPTS